MTVDSLNAILLEGMQRLGLNLGIISKINGETYVVHSCESGGIGIEPGDTFELSQTYCTDVIRDGATKHYQDVAEITEMLKHPCYLNTQLRAYIGTPVSVDGRIWGTLNYSSLSPRNTNYSKDEIKFLESQAKKVGAILEKQ